MKKINPKKCVICDKSATSVMFYKPNKPEVFGIPNDKEIKYGLCAKHIRENLEALSPKGTEKSRRVLNVAIAKKFGIDIEMGLDS
ncbi:MAG: hypothetical protein HQM08_29180 [Candidatus Riflebacteria bacterium]|nr:hypothetical protein [Candidatus Riflebacteria bacterium]